MSEGDKAWLGLLAYVTAYDFWAMATGRETLSSSFYRATRHPLRRWPTLAAWATVTAHLFRWIPDPYDPLRQVHYLSEMRRRAA